MVVVFTGCASNRPPLLEGYKTEQDHRSIKHITKVPLTGYCLSNRCWSSLSKSHHTQSRSSGFGVLISRPLHYVMLYFRYRTQASRKMQPVSFLERIKTCLLINRAANYIIDANMQWLKLSCQNMPFMEISQSGHRLPFIQKPLISTTTIRKTKKSHQN